MAKSKVKRALDAIENAETMADLTAAVADLEPKDKNAKAVAWQVYQATERIVGRTVKPR